MVSVIMVAEKPSICNAIAQALSGGNHETHGRTPPVHTFRGTFRGQQANIKVTSVVGHVYSTDFPTAYQSWDKVDPGTLFDAPVERVAEKKGIVHLLQNEGKGSDFLVLWLDCDKEGENICFEVISCVMPEALKRKELRTIGPQQRVFRAKFSAITPTDIQKAMGCLVAPNENESLSVEARQELDLKVGVAFSRFQTRFFQGKYSDLDSRIISYGPCQTPTLGFCVERHILIHNFVPEPYWLVSPQIKYPGFGTARFGWAKGRLFDKRVAAVFRQLVLEASVLRITAVQEREVKKGRPTPMNTVAMLKAVSKQLGIGPAAAMHAAENLYLQGFLSYPRTESTAYPASLDIGELLRQQTRSPVWGEHAAELLPNNWTKPKAGTDMGDHPPITPVRYVSSSELYGEQGRVYELVVKHFIASVSPDAIYLQTSVTAVAGEESFSVRGRQLLRPGWLALYSRSSIEDDADDGGDRGEEDEEGGEICNLPPFKQGETYALTEESLPLIEGLTSPPAHLSEADLIALMEKHGIGTDASIATHINNICERNYVQIAAGRRLVPTQLGTVLVQGYYRIDADLVLPLVRSSIEKQCDLIAKGFADKGDVVALCLASFQQKYNYFVKNIHRMDTLFEACFSPLTAGGKPWSKCGLSNRYLQLIVARPQRLYNKNTEEVYNLPQGGSFKLWSGLVCPVEGCGFELSLFQVGVGKDQRTYPLCPNCYNNSRPEWGSTPSAKGICIECPHPDGHPVVTKLTLCADEETGGVFILDPGSAPNSWRICSTRSNFIIAFPSDVVHKLTVLTDTHPLDDTHHMLQVEFHKGKAPPPLPPDIGKYRCYVLEDEVMQGLMEVKAGSNRAPRVPGRGGDGGEGEDAVGVEVK